MNCNSSLSSSNFNCGLLFSNVKSFLFWYSNFMTNRHVYFGIGVQLQSWNSKIIPNLIMIKLLNLQDSFWYCACLTKDHKLRINYGCIDENGKSGANVYRTKSVTRPACLSRRKFKYPAGTRTLPRLQMPCPLMSTIRQCTDCIHLADAPLL